MINNHFIKGVRFSKYFQGKCTKNKTLRLKKLFNAKITILNI